MRPKKYNSVEQMVNENSLREMEETTPMTSIERTSLRRWVKQGNSPESNPWGYLDEDSWPLNYLLAYRRNRGYYITVYYHFDEKSHLLIVKKLTKEHPLMYHHLMGWILPQKKVQVISTSVSLCPFSGKSVRFMVILLRFRQKNIHFLDDTHQNMEFTQGKWMLIFILT